MKKVTSVFIKKTEDNISSIKEAIRRKIGEIGSSEAARIINASGYEIQAQNLSSFKTGYRDQKPTWIMEIANILLVDGKK